jgi:hypothetical protein
MVESFSNSSSVERNLLDELLKEDWQWGHQIANFIYWLEQGHSKRGKEVRSMNKSEREYRNPVQGKSEDCIYEGHSSLGHFISQCPKHSYMKNK